MKTIAVTVVLGLTLAAGGAVQVSGCAKDDPSEGVPNVRLGMAPRDVRERFRPGGEGSWQTAVGVGDDTVLEWTTLPSNVKPSMLRARFEFHLGMLVAIRATLAEPAGTEKVTLTPKTVTVRSPGEGGTVVTVLARDCPTHKDEADTFAARAR